MVCFWQAYQPISREHCEAQSGHARGVAVARAHSLELTAREQQGPFRPRAASRPRPRPPTRWDGPRDNLIGNQGFAHPAALSAGPLGNTTTSDRQRRPSRPPAPRTGANAGPAAPSQLDRRPTWPSISRSPRGLQGTNDPARRSALRASDFDGLAPSPLPRITSSAFSLRQLLMCDERVSHYLLHMTLLSALKKQ